jgi:hypothetical protein
MVQLRAIPSLRAARRHAVSALSSTPTASTAPQYLDGVSVACAWPPARVYAAYAAYFLPALPAW